MRFLFDNKYAPLTEGMAFIQENLDTVLEKYLDWMVPLIKEAIEMQKLHPESKWNEYNKQLPKIIPKQGSFEDLLNEMMPFHYPEKTLLFECKNGWVGYLENGYTTETGRIRLIAERINEYKESIQVNAWLGGGEKIANGWSGGAFTRDLGRRSSLENYRNIMLSDQDRWNLDQFGEPLPFEEVEKYSEKLVRNRFTPEMLQRYLLHYGIDFFNEDFYMPEGSKAYIIEHVRDPFDGEKPETLAERRGTWY